MRYGGYLGIVLLLLCLAGLAAPTFNTFGYTLAVDTPDYQLYRRPSTAPRIMAMWQDVAVLLTPAATPFLTLVTDTRTNTSVSILFSGANFPGLLPDSGIDHCLLLPWTRNLTVAQPANEWRLVVITTRGQIYHNFPSRGTTQDGAAATGDAARFEESAVWDLPERRYPSKNPAATGTERYFPGLPDDAYAYRPPLNTAPTFTNPYGNGGFGHALTRQVNGTAVTYPRFYLPLRTPGTHPFTPWGANVPGDKISLIGTYRLNGTAGTRTCVFATDDGGRTWFNIYEFADAGTTLHNWGNPIGTAGLATAYPANAFVLRRRTLTPPTDTVKEPATKFALGAPIAVTAISRATPARLTTAVPHRLNTGNVVVLQTAPRAAAPAWAWMANDTASPVSGGTGILFKVKVVNTYAVELYEYVHSANNGLSAQYIYSANRAKDGWVITTGETYPNSWLLFLQMKEADTYTVKRATDGLPVYRLNSAAASPQGARGALLIDDRLDTCFYAAPATGTRVAGVYRGRLRDLDTAAAFTPVFASSAPPTLFRRVDGVLLYCDAAGTFGISFDTGATWSRTVLPVPLRQYLGKSMSCYVFDDCLLTYKR
jgi:hypothetical protein